MSSVSSESFPGHPKVLALLDKHLGQPLDDPLPDPPAPELLDHLLKGLNNCKKSADKRTESAREAAKIGQETLTRARKRLERQGSIAKSRPTLGDEEPKRSKVKDRDLAQRQSTADVELHPRTYAEGKNAGNSARHSTPGTKSPAQLTKVKRELSASPAPSDISHQNLASRGPTGAGPQPKKKKRKIAHDLETPSSHEHTNRGASPYYDRNSERASIPPRDREQSVRSARMDSPSAASSGPSYFETGVPSPRPSLPTSASIPTTGAPKIKLKLNNNKVLTATNSPSAYPEQTTQQFINPNLDFSLSRLGPNASSSPVPSSQTLIPPRLPIPAPAPSQPRRQKDVNQDFSIVKNVAQSVQWSTFWSGIETYIRDVGEEDVAMLTFRSDDRGVFDMPALGKHYQDIWDEEDIHLPFSQASNQAWVTSASMAQGPFQRDKERDSLGNRIGKGLRRSFPKDLTETDLRDERKGPGLLEERVVAGLWEGMPSGSGTKVKEESRPAGTVDGTGPLGPVRVKEEPGDEASSNRRLTHDGSPSQAPFLANASSDVTAVEQQPHWPVPRFRPENGNGSSHQFRMDMLNATIGETEEGVKRELRHLGLLDGGEEIDWTKKEDDEIAAGLRQCQRALRDQIARNNARKTKLTGLVMDRLGYGGYEKSLEGLEKVIEGTWLKRSARKMKKQKSSQRDEQAGVKRCIEKVPLPDAVKQAMQTRRQWIEVLGKTMQAPEVQGRYTGLPEKSVYADLDDLKNDAAERTWTQTHATTAL